MQLRYLPGFQYLFLPLRLLLISCFIFLCQSTGTLQLSRRLPVGAESTFSNFCNFSLRYTAALVFWRCSGCWTAGGDFAIDSAGSTDCGGGGDRPLHLLSSGSLLGIYRRMLGRSVLLQSSCQRWRAVADAVQHFDVCVIGAGPAGIAAALRAVDYNKRVCLIERERVGGADLWNGALQSKTMWQYANMMSKLRGVQAQRLYGETMEKYLAVDEEKMRVSMHRVSRTRERQVLAALESSKSVELVYGQATFSNNHEIQCHNRETKEYYRIAADYFIIATGSAPRAHPYVAVDGKLVMTSDHIMLAPLPSSLVIVGAGVIGCEFASIISCIGKTKVSIIDKSPHIMPREDPDVVAKVEQSMAQAGVVIHHDSDLYDMQPWAETPEEAMARHPDSPAPQSGVQYTIRNRQTRELTTFAVERALISIGRLPNYSGLGLENTTLRTRDNRLSVNEFGQCDGAPHIFAVGDAATRMQLVSMGESQAKVAMDYIYGVGKKVTPRLEESMSSVAFLAQAVASVGLNETQCRQRGIAFLSARYSYEVVSRAVAAANTDGFVKIIVADDAQRRILGVCAVGLNASTLVDLGSLAIQSKHTVYDLAGRLTAYPAISQAFQECLRSLLDYRGTEQVAASPGVTRVKWAPADMERGICYKGEAAREADTLQAKQREEQMARCALPSATETATVSTAAATPPLPPSGTEQQMVKEEVSIRPGSFFRTGKT